jgi:alpha-mannosidase
VTAEGPVLAEITVTRRLGASTLRQAYRLWSNSARLEVATEIDWHDRRTYLRAAFPLAVLSEEAVFDQAIGVTRRATHANTSWQRAQFEGSGHRFASLSETGFGAALLSADKYGFSAKENVLTLSLIRGPMYPDMLADEGMHRFTYALLPHDGAWWGEEVQAEAELLSDPLRHAPTARTEPVAPIGWEGLHLRFHALKRAEDGPGHILRLSEPAGRRGKVAFRHAGAKPAQPVDGLERPLAEGDQVTPFHLLTRRF